MRIASVLGLVAVVGAVTIASVAPAQAAWRDRYGYWHRGAPPWAYSYPVYAPPVVVVHPRVWIGPHWWRGYWVRGHWG